MNKLGEVQISFFELNDIRLPKFPARPRFNIAPTTPVAVICPAPAGRELLEMRWGLRPSWAKADQKIPLMHNARAETVATLSSFRGPFKTRRCIVPASGYYEWRSIGTSKQPYYFERRDGYPLAFAGIWEQNPESGETVAIITTTPNAEAAAVHNRMPVILSRSAWARWFEPTPLSDEESSQFLVPAPNESLTIWPVDRAVGNVRNDNSGLIEPLAQLL